MVVMCVMFFVYRIPRVLGWMVWFPCLMFFLLPQNWSMLMRMAPVVFDTLLFYFFGFNKIKIYILCIVPNMMSFKF